MILCWHNPSNGRRYQAVLAPDLFGDWILWRGWCGADGRRGGEMRTVLEGEGAGLSALRRIGLRRRARGYVLRGAGLERALAHEAPEADAPVSGSAVAGQVLGEP